MLRGSSWERAKLRVESRESPSLVLCGRVLVPSDFTCKETDPVRGSGSESEGKARTYWEHIEPQTKDAVAVGGW